MASRRHPATASASGAYAQSHGIATALWISASGIDNFLAFLDNSLLATVGLSLLAHSSPW